MMELINEIKILDNKLERLDDKVDKLLNDANLNMDQLDLLECEIDKVYEIRHQKVKHMIDRIVTESNGKLTIDEVWQLVRSNRYNRMLELASNL